jgi:hypothetical protein
VGEAPLPAMTHIAVQEAFGGSPVDWLEHASGEGEGVTCCALRPTAPPSSYPVRVQCTAWRFPVAHLTLFALRPINQMKRIVIMTHSIPPLVLPKRFEALQRQAQSQDADISRIVYRVDDAATRVEDLLRQVRDGGIGRFEVFLGKSGSRKTTFFSTLTKFFTGVSVHRIEQNIPLKDIAKHIQRHNTGQSPSIWFIHDRDNPTIDLQTAKLFAESLRPLFREQVGQVVLIWPITATEEAKVIADAAWEIGRDSIVDVISHGLYSFAGLSKSQYYEVADLTVRNLIPSETLESFGLTEDKVQSQLALSDTTGEFYTRLEAESRKINLKVPGHS